MKNIYKALAKFQQECPIIHRDTQGYGYSYTDLPEILRIVNPLLEKHGLGFTQLMNGEYLKTTLFHYESGESISSDTKIQEGVQLHGQNVFQVLGSQITYLRRYSLSSMLGIVTDKDLDAHGVETSKKPDSEPAQKTANKKPKRLTKKQKEGMLKWTKDNLENFKTVLTTYALDDKEKKWIGDKIKEFSK